MGVEIVSRQEIHDGSKLRIKVHIPNADRNKLVDQSLKALVAEGRLEAPAGQERAALEKRFGADGVLAGVTARVAQLAGAQAAASDGLHIMFNPEPVNKTVAGLFDTGEIEMEIELVLRPSMELSSYDPVHVTYTPAQVTEEMIDTQLKQEMARFARFEPTEVPLAEGDRAVMDMDVEVNGSPAKELSGNNMQLMIAHGMMPEGFIDNVKGMQVGEQRHFTFTAPNPEDPAAGPDTFVCTVTLHDKRRRTVPELTDEFVQKNLSATDKTVAQFRERVRKFLQQRQSDQDQQTREAVADAELATRLVGTIPDLYIELTSQEIAANVQANLAAQGLTLSQFLQQQKMDTRQFQMSVMQQARDSLRQGFALDALFRHLDLEVTPDDENRALHELAPGYEEEARANFKQNYAWSVVTDMAQRFAAHNWLVSTAVFEKRQ